MKRAANILGGLLLLLLASGVGWQQATSAASDAPFEDAFLAPYGGDPVFYTAFGDKPSNNWRVCRDLGVGPVPGLGTRRQRFRLCHSDGWEVLVYCLQPDLPAPAIGTRCSRINNDTYHCGSGMQRLREYSVVETPIPPRTSIPVPSRTPLPPTPQPPTPPIPTTPAGPPQTTPPEENRPPRASRPTPRAPSGGRGNFDLSGLLNLSWLAGPTKTPFLPHRATATAFQPRPPTQMAFTPTPTAQTPNGFYALDLADPGHRVRILIFPPDRQVNGGKPIPISFIPGRSCAVGDNRGCVNTFQTEAGALATFVTVHSGVGGEGQAFRYALEGSGINSAGLALREVRANLKALEGAEVVIIQGKRRYEGFTLAVITRVPPRLVGAYFKAPVWNALRVASTVDQGLKAWVNADLPYLAFETCGWRMPGEPWSESVPDTAASVYIGVILKAP